MYESWWGIDTLPNVNENEPDYSDYITGRDGVLEYWMSLGAAGFRLDVADELVERADEIIEANRKDMERGRANNMPEGLLDRLMLNVDRIDGIAPTAPTTPAANTTMTTVCATTMRIPWTTIRKLSTSWNMSRSGTTRIGANAMVFR